jgi:hypothetical protein
MKNDCAAVNPDGSLETLQDTINRLVQNRNELVDHLQLVKKYSGFLRSVIRCGENLPDDYDIESFKKSIVP